MTIPEYSGFSIRSVMLRNTIPINIPEPGGHLNIKMPSYQYRDSHVKDKTVSPTVLSLTWESPYLGKTVFILRRGPGRYWPTASMRYQPGFGTKWHVYIDYCYMGQVTKVRQCGCLVTWFWYHLIAKPGNKTAAPSRPDPYTAETRCH